MSSSFKQTIVKRIARAIVSTSHVDTLKAYQVEQKIHQSVRIQHANKKSHGLPQYSLSLSELAKTLDKEGQSQMYQLNRNLEGIVSENKDGILYFKMDSARFAQDTLASIRCEQAKYGHFDHSGDVEKVCVEFSSPNIAKPFHVGHLRSTILGHILSNMYEAAGYDVLRVNFLGDWGTQFGLLSLGLQRFSSEDKWKSDPLQEFFKAYVSINNQVKEERGAGVDSQSPTYDEALQVFARLEQGDPELNQLWSDVRSASLEELNSMYQRLGVTFDLTMPESDYQKTEEVLKCLRISYLLKFDEKGVGYVEKQTPQGQRRVSVVKSDGASLYMTRDLAAALDRRERFTIDRMHYVVENGQRDHFANLADILSQLGLPWAQRPIEEIHIGFGRVHGMSTRSGQVVFLTELLDQAKEQVRQAMVGTCTTQVETANLEEVAEALALTAIIIQDLKAHRSKNYTFSWDRALSFKADSGVFAQYCHARLCSLLSISGLAVQDDVDLECLDNDLSLHRLVLHMAGYSEAFNRALSTLQPHHLVQYLFQLCHLVNAAYTACPIKGMPQDIAQARLLVFDSSRQVLHNCLKVLGSTPLSQM